jgi:acetyl-CoA C-acetyltransferase
MELTGKRAFEMARIGPADLDFIDLYSCFPIAVEVGAEALGLSLDDPRGLTVTGGLPYFGGPGNNYAMHSVVTMLEKLRGKPGGWGLCTANGWYLTKQSTGIYSTTPVEGVWEREDPAIIQRQIDALPHPAVEEHPQGPATVETYTIVHTRDGYHMGIIVGRDSHDSRFMAVLPDDEATLKSFEAAEGVGRTGTVSRHPDGKRNLFTPD